MNFAGRSLGLKLNLGLLVFGLLLGVATSATVWYGFQRAQDTATKRSRAASEETGKLVLVGLANVISEAASIQLDLVAANSEHVARYLESSLLDVPLGEPVLAPRPGVDGAFYDTNPRRTSDLEVRGSLDDPIVREDIAYSAALDSVFPALFDETAAVSPDRLLASKIVFSTPSGVRRSYPRAETLSGHSTNRADAFALSQPGQKASWTPRYDDGGGPVLSARTAVYQGTRFRGFVDIDITVTQVITSFDSIEPTKGGFAFFVKGDGSIQDGKQAGWLSAEMGSNAAFRDLVEAMAQAQPSTLAGSGKLALGDRDYFIAYKPLPSLGGAFAIVAPVEEITASAATITAGIEEEGARALSLTLLVVLAVLLVGLASASYLNRRVLIRPIEALVAGTRTVADGNFDTPIAVRGSDELATLARSFNTMTQRVREDRDTLERRVEERTSELSVLLAENVRLLERARDAATLEERQRLARELHDSVSQAIYGIGLTASAARTLMQENPELAAEPVDTIVALAAGAMAEMRALIFELRPESLELEGLVGALTKQALATSSRHRIEVATAFSDEPSVSLAVKEVFYRVCQEALQNIVKHAAASRVSVRLSQTADELVLEVSDNGQGFDASRAYPGHLGLVSIAERAAMIGARYSVTSQPGQGTVVRLSFATAESST